MDSVRSLLSRRFKNNGCAAISVDAGAREALASFRSEIERKEISLSSHKSCPLCGNASGTLIAEKDRLGVPSRTIVCGGCRLVMNDSFLDSKSSELFYKKYWRRIQWGMDAEKNFALRTRPDSYAWKRLAFAALNLGPGLKGIQTVMEPGCGDGCNLLPYHLMGKDVLGCDYDEECLEAGRRTGMPLLQGDIRRLVDSNKKADLVILSHVVEHFIDVNQELGQVQRILRKGGYVYAEVPGIRNMNRPRSLLLSEDGLRSTNNFLEYLQFQHNYHFELRTLRRFFERRGFSFICGDEWVRAIFRYTDEPVRDKAGLDKISGSDMLEHLRQVEQDYLSIKNRLIVGARRALALGSRGLALFERY